MCNTIVNKFLFAAICLVLDWIQSNQSGFPLKVAKKLSEIFLGPSLWQDRFWSEKIFRLLISQFYLLIDLGIKNYLTCFSSSILKLKPIVKIIDNWKNYTKEFDLDIHFFPLKIPTIFKKQWLRISRMPCKKIWVHFFSQQSRSIWPDLKQHWTAAFKSLRILTNVFAIAGYLLNQLMVSRAHS